MRTFYLLSFLSTFTGGHFAVKMNIPVPHPHLVAVAAVVFAAAEKDEKPFRCCVPRNRKRIKWTILREM